MLPNVNLNVEELANNNRFFRIVSKCYLQIILLVVFILFVIEFFYLFQKNPNDLISGDFFTKYLNLTNKVIKQK